MVSTIIFCEGRRDFILLDETLITYIKFNDYKFYNKKRKLAKELRAGETRTVSIIYSGGFPNCAYDPLYFSSDFWGDNLKVNYGIINDGDVGCSYELLKEKAKKYVEDRMGPIELKPEIIENDEEKELKIGLNPDEEIIYWNILVEGSLEIKVMEYYSIIFSELSN